MISKMILAVGVIAFVAYWFLGKVDKTVDYQSRAVSLQVQQINDDVQKKSKEISSGTAIENPEYLARKEARDQELAQIDKKMSKDRTKADSHVEKTEKQADELDALEEKNK